MADILSYLNAIKTAVYGKDVRNSIHDAIKQCYDDGKAGSIDPTARSQIANLVAHNNDTEGNSELLDIRVGADGTTYPSAGEAVREQVNAILNKLDFTDAEQIAKERLSGKTIIFMGDSYTKGAESQFSALCAKYGATADNYGVASSSICGTTDGNKGFQPMWNRTFNVCSTYTSNGTTSNVGAIVFMGGANDGIGNSTWIGSGINDDNTGRIYGAMNSILSNFRNTFDCPIFVILQPTFPNGTTENKTVSSATASLWGFDSAAQCAALDSDHFARYSQYVKQTAVKACAEYHDCKIVDCFFNWDISVFSPSQKATYWKSDGHPTGDGYQHIADTLEKKMLDVFGKKLSPL